MTFENDPTICCAAQVASFGAKDEEVSANIRTIVDGKLTAGIFEEEFDVNLPFSKVLQSLVPMLRKSAYMPPSIDFLFCYKEINSTYFLDTGGEVSLEGKIDLPLNAFMNARDPLSAILNKESHLATYFKGVDAIQCSLEGVLQVHVFDKLLLRFHHLQKKRIL